jgi:hypothetical protein
MLLLLLWEEEENYVKEVLGSHKQEPVLCLLLLTANGGSLISNGVNCKQRFAKCSIEGEVVND